MDFEHNYAEFGNAISCGRVTIQKWCNIILCTLDIYAVWTRMIGWANAHVFAGWVSRRVHVLLFLGVQICKSIFFFKKIQNTVIPESAFTTFQMTAVDLNHCPPVSERFLKNHLENEFLGTEKARFDVHTLYSSSPCSEAPMKFSADVSPWVSIRVLQWRSMKRGRAALWYLCFASGALVVIGGFLWGANQLVDGNVVFFILVGLPHLNLVGVLDQALHWMVDGIQFTGSVNVPFIWLPSF